MLDLHCFCLFLLSWLCHCIMYRTGHTQSFQPLTAAFHNLRKHLTFSCIFNQFITRPSTTALTHTSIPYFHLVKLLTTDGILYTLRFQEVLMLLIHNSCLCKWLLYLILICYLCYCTTVLIGVLSATCLINTSALSANP